MLDHRAQKLCLRVLSGRKVRLGFMFLSESVLCRFRDITIHTVGDFPFPLILQFLEKTFILQSNFAISKVLDLSLNI